MDGSVKMWDATSLELVMCAREAHEGGKVHCAAVGPDGNLYTGGDDKVRSPNLECNSTDAAAKSQGPVLTGLSEHTLHDCPAYLGFLSHVRQGHDIGPV